MIREFLTTFSQLVGNVQKQNTIDNDDEIVKHTVELYPLLSEDEKTQFFDIVKTFDEHGLVYRLYFEFLCLHLYKDKRYADDILDCLIVFDMDLSRRLYYYTVLDRELFVTGISADYGKSLYVEKKLVEEIRKDAVKFPEYKPYSERIHKSVVIIIRPFLGEYHSPSLQTINLDNYLRKLGYNTFYISYSENEILEEYAGDVCNPFKRSILYSGITKVEYNCFDMKIQGIHFDIRKDYLSDDINALVMYISQINPEFVIGIEGCNILADVCNEFTDVICMNVVDDLPITLSDNTLRYFPGEHKKGYLEAGKYGKSVFDAEYANEFRPYNDEKVNEIKLPQGRFHICIMGNRLDEELGDEMLAIIRKVLYEIPDTDMVFIGDCPKTEKRLDDVKDRCIFLGYVDRCEDTVAGCSLFLNPPRKGGGGGGYMAIKRGIPVYTLGNGDVASCVGKEFVHDSYDDLNAFISRCINEPGYFDHMRTLANENYIKSCDVDSLENIRVFINEYIGSIKNHK